MPLYAFQRPDGEVVYKALPISKAPRLGAKVRIDGQRCTRILEPDARLFRNTPGNWPMESVSQGVNPRQIADAVKLDHSLGVHADYNPKNGNVIFTSRKHRAEWCRAHKVKDWDAGYSDPQ
jgi:hypothetical protein